MAEAVVVFAKQAVAGQVKTRLCPPLSGEEAARFYVAFARDALETAARFVAEGEDGQCRAFLAWSGSEEAELTGYARELGFEVVEQGEGGLGERLKRVVATLRDRGVERVFIVGSDSPTLSVQHLKTARLELLRNDVVFGPSFDGGYYLVALGPEVGGRPAPERVVFEGIRWSTREVMEQSWRRANEAGLLCELLGFWYDVDTFEDLQRLRFHLCEYLTKREPLSARHTRQILEETMDRE